MTETLVTMYQALLESGDSRTNRLPLVRSPVTAIMCFVLYMLFVKTAPTYLRNRKRLNLKSVILPYNIAMVVFSLYMCKEFFLSAYLGNFNLKCEPINPSLDHLPMRLVNVIWWFYISKIVELLDTVFMILNHKQNQLTFLHTFHHGTMIFSQWLATKYFPGGHGFAHGFLNSFVHVIMYSYYALACVPALKKYLWWKKYLTMLQLIQFVLIITHVCLGLHAGCLNPSWPSKYMASYCCILIVLFSNFYLHSYNTKRTQKQKNTNNNDSLKQFENGHAKTNKKLS